MTLDHVNGLFEMLGGLLMWYNVYTLWKARSYSGVSMIPTAFFTCWGAWNLVYYAGLGQWWSWAGGINLVIANATWWGQMWKYRGETN